MNIKVAMFRSSTVEYCKREYLSKEIMDQFLEPLGMNSNIKKLDTITSKDHFTISGLNGSSEDDEVALSFLVSYDYMIRKERNEQYLKKVHENNKDKKTYQSCGIY